MTGVQRKVDGDFCWTYCCTPGSENAPLLLMPGDLMGNQPG